MMAPQYERARLLHEAIQFAAGNLSDPIERIEVTRQAIFVSASGKRLELRYGYADSHGPDGVALLGGGSWSVWVAGAQAETQDRAATTSWWRRLRARLGR